MNLVILSLLFADKGDMHYMQCVLHSFNQLSVLVTDGDGVCSNICKLFSSRVLSLFLPISD